MPRQTRRFLPSLQHWTALLLGLLALAGLYATSRYNFLLFHSLAEAFSIVIAIAVFVIFWNTRHLLHNDFYLIIGFGALFGGLFDVIYIFAYPGMSVLPVSDGNLALQAKTVAQAYVAFSCVAAFAFLRRKVDQHLALLICGLVAAIALLAIYPWRIFPDCYIAGVGLTPFAKGALVLNSLGYLASLGLLIANRREFGSRVFKLLLVPSIAFFVQDVFSAFAMDINGFARTVAHLCQVVSLYFVYRVFVVVGLRNPYDLLFIERKRAEAQLKELNEHLEQRVAERAEALIESEQRLALATSGARVGIYDWDAVTGERQWTPEVESIFGYAPTATTATTTTHAYKDWAERVHPDDLPRVIEDLQQCFAECRAHEIEYRIIWPDGSIHWVQVRGRPVCDSEGRPLRMMGTVMDVTERKAADEELKAAQESAELANRAKDHFLAVLSHELRTPLTPVVMGVSMLQDRADLQPNVRETLEMVRRNVEMEARLIDDLLDVTRITRGKIELDRSLVELCTVIQRAVEVCKPDIEARELHFDVDLGPSAPYWVEADVPRLQQVFWNLLKNAVKFTPRGGCVGIRCRASEKEVLVEVSDSGIGIESEALSRIFDAFEQAERSITRQFGGLGLGLTISKALVELHGGTISVHSEGKHKGAMFRISLPLAAPDRRPEKPAPAAPSQRIFVPLRILLVEDHGVTATILTMMLSAEGHAVERAGDIATAVNMAESGAYDLLLSDLGLPDGSGHDLMRQLRQRGNELPGIVLSGYGQEEDIKRSWQAGFAAHLTKPASREAVIETIGRVMSTGDSAIVTKGRSAPPRESLVFDSEAALNLCFREQRFLDEMIEFFFLDCESLLPEIDSALRQGDHSEVARLAHRLRGTLVYLSADLAIEAAAEVERLGFHGGHAHEVERSVRSLERECQVLKATLKEYQTRSAAAAKGRE